MLSPCYWCAIHSLSIQFLSLFNFFYHLSFLRHPLYFCQKQSVDFPVDCLALPQSQTWRDVSREGEIQRVKMHTRRGDKRGLRVVMIWNPFWRSIISVPPGAPQWADSTAELHSITCSRSPVCLSPTHSQPPFLPSSPGSSLALQRKMRISHSDTMHHCPAGKSGRPPRCIKLYVHVLSTERQIALNSSGERQTEKETDK